MTIALSAAVILLGVLTLLLLGSQVEMYRTIEQLREFGGLVDRPVPLDLPKNRTPSKAGLPAELDTTVRAVVLLLSDRCGTCRALAGSLDGAVNEDLYLIVEPGTGVDGASELALTYRLDPARTVIDETGDISSGVGIRVTPAAIVIENGRMTRASTVPSTRQLTDILSTVRAHRSSGASGMQPVVGQPVDSEPAGAA
ncbi:hypothetical protein QLQ12_32660 [Actinoplanes sp. NEAU-A12]|uniref:Thioredoxin domain-containing protein n=1 Tax=Actinoplanes sandaracinus TaxID=3045177 RepID=A0ABT6WUF8_9ACTN|nr:hypothetical protein [Actinoplanes sandaracinus]MDI6103372.1 hypothetical protein [Actinoplanes sandaracinus]